jgi:hypothetical protein
MIGIETLTGTSTLHALQNQCRFSMGRNTTFILLGLTCGRSSYRKGYNNNIVLFYMPSQQFYWEISGDNMCIALPQ